VTQLAFLRHLTNKTILGDQVLTPALAWGKHAEFLALPEVRFLAEPPGLDESFGKLSQIGRTSPNLWTDAFLASFAQCEGLRLVTFDHGFARFTELELLILKPE
jgi:predicted nucleic acid-binding protein